jgi:hypothetical protein
LTLGTNSDRIVLESERNTMSRKTIEVAKIREKINDLINRTTGEESKAERNTLKHLAEFILHESNNYRGFIYSDLTQEHYDALRGETRFKDLGIDETRVKYL